MSLQWKTRNDALLFEEFGYNTRWIDAFGEDVVKYLSRAGIPCDDITGDPSEFTNTETGTNVIINHTTEGEFLKITTGGTEYNGVNLQLKGSAFKLESGKPAYFGIKFKSENATKGDFLFGLCEVDTSLLATGTAHALSVTDDGVYFYHLNDETDITFVNEKGGTEGKTSVGTTHDTDYHIFEIYYDGTDLFAYYDDALVVQITSGIADQALTPSINCRAGDDGAEVFEIAWMRAIQLR